MFGKIIPWIPSNFGAQEKQEDDLVQLMAGAGESTGYLGNFYELSIPWRVLESGNQEIIRMNFGQSVSLSLLATFGLFQPVAVHESHPVLFLLQDRKHQPAIPRPSAGVHAQWISMEDIQLPVINMAMENPYIGIKKNGTVIYDGERISAMFEITRGWPQPVPFLRSLGGAEIRGLCSSWRTLLASEPVTRRWVASYHMQMWFAYANVVWCAGFGFVFEELSGVISSKIGLVWLSIIAHWWLSCFFKTFYAFSINLRWWAMSTERLVNSLCVFLKWGNITMFLILDPSCRIMGHISSVIWIIYGLSVGIGHPRS